METRFGPEARKGAAVGVLLVTGAMAVIAGWNLHSGFGLLADLLFAFLVAAIAIPLVALITAIMLTIARRLPRRATAFFLGACIFMAMPWPPQLGLPLGVVCGLLEGLFGATLATLIAGNIWRAPLSRKLVTGVLFVAALSANIALLVFFAGDGTDSGLLRYQSVSPLPPSLQAANPAETGPYAVKTLFYGSGTDLRRPEYGKSVAIRTTTVDASQFFKDFKGWRAAIRRRYWGFGMDKLPLNARVWYPSGPGPFPLAIIVHGNHNMADFSDPGYAYLGSLLASRGFIFASIDENFLNSGLFHDPPKQQAVRGWMLLEHLKLWRTWNRTPGNPFYQKVDMDNIALMGHSRGGEAAATAVLFNRISHYPDDATIKFQYGFPIKSVVAIAPADGQYKPAGQWRYIENVNYLTLQGSNDADVSSFVGSRQWDHVRYTESGPWFKAELYVYRANHGQFNTAWGRSDFGAMLGRFLNLKPLMSGEDQRRIAEIYISAFVEATLHQKREYVPLFRDYRSIRSWLPHTYYISRYEDASYQTISDFNEDPDVTTTTTAGGQIGAENLSVWREGRIPWRQGDRDYNGVFLGWNRGDAKKSSPVPTYSISLPAEFGKRVTWRSVLSMSLAATDEKAPLPGKNGAADKDKDKKENITPQPVDFTVEIRARDGAGARLPLSRFGVLPPPFKVRFTKLSALEKLGYPKEAEPIFQTIDLPLAAFATDAHFDPAKISMIRLLFDRTRESVIILSQIGIDDGQ